MNDEEKTEAVVEQSLKAKPITQRDIALRVRRKKVLDKVRDAEIRALLELVRAFSGHGDEMDTLFDEICDRMSNDRVYEQMEMLCLEVLELRKRLRRLGMDSNWEPKE